MNLILLILFVYGISIVIETVAEFFDFDIDYFYHYRSDKKHCTGYSDRPKWQQFLLKPTIYCNVCMSSFWGTVCYWLLLNGNSVQEWVLFCVICAGVIHTFNRVMSIFD